MRIKVMMSGSKREILKNKVDPPTKCGKRGMAHSVLSTECNEYMLECGKQRISSNLTKSFVCEGCFQTVKELC